MFNRLKYDTCSTKTEFSDNVSIFDHLMDSGRYIHGAPCRHEKGLAGGNAASTIAPILGADNVADVRGSQVAVENDLRGQTRSSTRCPAYDYIPEKGKSTSIELYKPVVHPTILTDSLNHLGGCQMLAQTPAPVAPESSGRISCEY